MAFSLRDRIDTMLAELPRGARGPAPRKLIDSLSQDLGEGECWPWLGRRGRNGYGIAVIPMSRGEGTSAHRLVWELLNGPVPDGWQVDHLCHDPASCALGSACPHRCCVNPTHLEPVTPKTNLMRSGSFVAVNATKTHCYKGHPFGPENTYVAPNGRRACRTCQRANWRRYDAAKRGAA